ncbi:MAG: cyclic nucleotide-binding domain-containing protein [Gammaproteobacteria bacterium]|nr:cyclic nucleotide-binding domain-containing protein [Gammaproteobacteria bacterium]
MINELLNTYLFKDMEYDALQEIAKFSMRLQLNDGDVLIHENESENFDVFVLCSGPVEVISSSSASVSSDVAISKQDLEIFGEISWITSRKRTATVRCRGEVEAIRINGKVFMSYLEQHPKVGFEVMRKIAMLLAQRLVSTDTLLKQILWNSTL